MIADKTNAIQILKKIKQRYAKKTTGQKDAKEVLGFLLGKEMYGFYTKIVKEIVKPVKIFSIPATPDYLKGAVNLRGEILPVIDFKKFLGMSKLDISENMRIVVVGEEDKIGFLVDSIIDIIYIPVLHIKPPLTTMKKIKFDYFDGEAMLENKLLSIFDTEKIISSEKITNLQGKE